VTELSARKIEDGRQIIAFFFLFFFSQNKNINKTQNSKLLLGTLFSKKKKKYSPKQCKDGCQCNMQKLPEYLEHIHHHHLIPQSNILNTFSGHTMQVADGKQVPID
jgi:hypothetical protein